MNNSKDQYYNDYCDILSRRLIPSEEIKKFVGSNSDIIGKLAETQVRKFVRDILYPLRVSHGAVTNPDSFGSEKSQQVDTIIWTPNPLPALVEVDDFAVIPWANSMGVLEIKNSAYPGVGKNIKNILDKEKDLTNGYLLKKRNIQSALGVIVLERDDHKITKELQKLREKKKVVVLLSQEGNDYKPNTQDFINFINFLGNIRKRTLQLGGLTIDTNSFDYGVNNAATGTEMKNFDGIIENKNSDKKLGSSPNVVGRLP